MSFEPSKPKICQSVKNPGWLAGVVDEIDKAIRATARTITQTKQSGKVKGGIKTENTGEFSRLKTIFQISSLNYYIQ